MSSNDDDPYGISDILTSAINNIDIGEYDPKASFQEFLTADNISKFDDLIKILEGLRFGLDESNISKDLKVQIVLDILEIVFAVYEGRSIKELKEEIFEIFKPTDYFQILSAQVVERLSKMEDHTDKAIETSK